MKRYYKIYELVKKTLRKETSLSIIKRANDCLNEYIIETDE